MAKNKTVLFGEVLLRLSPPNYLRLNQTTSLDLIYAGSELNIANSLSRFGLPADFVTRLPENALAQSMVETMRQNGVDTNHIIYGGERLGLYFLEIGAGHRSSQVVYDRQYSSMTTLKPGMIDWKEVFKNALWFHWSGITPGISQSAADATLEAVEIAEQSGLTISTDFNYRSILWQYGKSAQEIMEPLVAKSQIAIVGEYACEQYFGIKPKSGVSVNESLVNQLKDRFPSMEKIAITNREVVHANHNKWSADLFSNKGTFHSKKYDITDVVDRIGTGDSFAAGLIYGLQEGWDEQKALEFATAASCLKHTIFGDTNLVSVEEVERLVNEVHVGGVRR